MISSSSSERLISVSRSAMTGGRALSITSRLSVMRC